MVESSGPTAIRRSELAEMAAYQRLFDSVPSDLARRLGLRTVPVAGGLALMTSQPRAPLVFNRVIGLGWRAPVGAQLLAELDELYRAHGVRGFAIDLVAQPSSSGAGPVLRTAGYFRFAESCLLARQVDRTPVVESDLVVRPAEVDDAVAIAAVAGEVFRVPAELSPLLAEGVRQRTVAGWLACEGNRPVACALTVPVAADLDWVGWVATLPSHRGRGAQSALSAVQLADSSRRRVEAVVLEVAAGTEVAPSASLRNYLRLGWSQVATRTTYIRRLRS